MITSDRFCVRCLVTTHGSSLFLHNNLFNQSWDQPSWLLQNVAILSHAGSSYPLNTLYLVFQKCSLSTFSHVTAPPYVCLANCSYNVLKHVTRQLTQKYHKYKRNQTLKVLSVETTTCTWLTRHHHKNCLHLNHRMICGLMMSIYEVSSSLHFSWKTFVKTTIFYHHSHHFSNYEKTCFCFYTSTRFNITVVTVKCFLELSGCWKMFHKVGNSLLFTTALLTPAHSTLQELNISLQSFVIDAFLLGIEM